MPEIARLTCYRTTMARVGRSCLYRKNERFILFQGTTITSRRFINQTLSHEEYKAQDIEWEEYQ